MPPDPIQYGGCRVPESSGELLLDLSRESWATFASSHREANIFHHPAWSAVLSECYNYRPFVAGIRDAQGALRAGLPMMEVGGRRSRRWVSLPFTDHCAPLHDGEDHLSALNAALARLALDAETPELSVRYDLPQTAGLHSSTEFVLHNVALGSDTDAVLGRVSKMHRRNVRTAVKKGVRVESGTGPERIEEFYRLHLETRRRQGSPIQPRRFFTLLDQHVLQPGLGFILSAYSGQQCVASAVFLEWQGTLMYKYGASSPNAWDLRPNNLLFWEALQYGCDKGLDRLDLGRTDLGNTGLREFKSGWGAIETPLVYATSRAPSSGKKDVLMKAASEVIRRSPRWVCRATGETLYKYFG